MNDAQIIAISITVLAIFGGVLINNSRLADVRDALRAEMLGTKDALRADLVGGKDTLHAEVVGIKDTLRAEMRADKGDVMNAISELRRVLEANHDTTLRMLADIDQRVTRLEARG